MLKIPALVLAAALCTVACSSDHSTGIGQTPAHFGIVSGDKQSGVVGTQLANPLVVRVTDAAGQPVPGQSVNFVVTSGGGSVFGGTETTSQDGTAQELWTLGTSTADSQVLQARAVNSTSGQAQTFATFHAIPVAGPAASVAAFAGDSQSAAGARILAESIAVFVSDRYHNPAPGATVKWRALDGVVNPTTSITTAAGVASTHWRIGYALKKNYLTASVNALPTVMFSATTLPGKASSYSKLAGDNQSGIVGLDLAVPPSVLVRDSTGQPVANVTVVFYIAAGDGYITGPSGVMSDSTGVAALGGWVIGSGANGLGTGIPGSGLPNLAFSATSAGTSQPTTVTSLGIASCSLNSLASLECWGTGTRDELGSASLATSSSRPVVIATSQSFQSVVATGGGTMCGLTAAGAAYCWGSNIGQALGRGPGASSTMMDPTPQPVIGGLTFTSLAAASESVCGLTSGGDAYCWGSPAYGVLGDGNPFTQNSSDSGQSTPGRVVGGLKFTTIAAGSLNVCGVTTSGVVYCWGDNSWGQLTSATISGASSPQQIVLPSAATQVGAGSLACALVAGGEVYCWGIDVHGELGRGDSTTAPVPTPTLVAGGVLFTSITVGGSSACGLHGDASRCLSRPSAERPLFQCSNCECD